jgi:ATP-dependent protease ClpP protease subunit
MPKTTYHIQLKGYVGGEDFDRKSVDSLLANQSGKRVNVLIDSLGGSLATGLSISAAFKQHGDVAVHFVGLNASAATIASLGAAHISIDAGAMYLVHKCSMAFFEWGSLNADQFATLIADCEKVKADLDKLDQNCAQLYAARCKRKPEELLTLMKVGGWLSAKEALDWGFVDEITDLADEPAPKLTDALASAMANEGMPIPNIPLAESDKDSAFAKFLNAISSIFNSKSHNPMPTENSAPTPKTYTEDEYNALSQQLTEANALNDSQKKTIEDHTATIADKDKTIADRDAKIADLEAKLAAKPAASTTTVVEDSKPGSKSEPLTDAEAYCQTVNSARKLFNSI